MYTHEKEGLFGAVKLFGSLYQIREGRWILAIIYGLIVTVGAFTLRAEYYPLAPWGSLWSALSIVDSVRFIFINVAFIGLLWLMFKIVVHEINPGKF